MEKKKIHTTNKQHRETKNCIVCNKPFQNRKKWSSRNMWADIRYCSDACRKK